MKTQKITISVTRQQVEQIKRNAHRFGWNSTRVNWMAEIPDSLRNQVAKKAIKLFPEIETLNKELEKAFGIMATFRQDHKEATAACELISKEYEPQIKLLEDQISALQAKIGELNLERNAKQDAIVNAEMVKQGVTHFKGSYNYWGVSSVEEPKNG